MSGRETIALSLALALTSSVVLATDWRTSGSQRRAVEGSRSSGSSSSSSKPSTSSQPSSSPTQTTPYQAPQPDPAEQARQQRINEANAAYNQGLAYAKDGAWAKAVAAFQSAADRNPNAENLEQLRIAKSRLAEQERDKEASAQIRQGVQGISQSLTAVASAGGLEFGNIVDTRHNPSALPKSLDNAITGAYADAPPGVTERVRKGYEAVLVQDWKVAKAWFQDALNRDPNNVGLKRLIALTDADQKSSPEKRQQQAIAQLKAAPAKPRSEPPSPGLDFTTDLNSPRR